MAAIRRRCRLAAGALDLIVSGEGIGALLAEGSRRMALDIGHDTIDFAPQVKGTGNSRLRSARIADDGAWASPSARAGADHNRSGAYEVDFSEAVDRRNVGPEAAVLAVETEDKAALMDSLILCKFLRGVFVDFFAEAAEMLQSRHRLGCHGRGTASKRRSGSSRRRSGSTFSPAGLPQKTRCRRVGCCGHRCRTMPGPSFRRNG